MNRSLSVFAANTKGFAVQIGTAIGAACCLSSARELLGSNEVLSTHKFNEQFASDLQTFWLADVYAPLTMYTPVRVPITDRSQVVVRTIET